MSNVISHEQCPYCAKRGRDRHHDNLGVYLDGSKYCFACGYYQPPSFRASFLTKEKPNDSAKAVLPSDFTREIPSKYWQWLLQYGLPMSYWKTYCGFTEKEQRLVITHGSPIHCSVGRSLDPLAKGKWRTYGNRTEKVTCLGEELSGSVVLVEDLVSAHKVAQVSPCIPLFGTDVFDRVVHKLKALGRPVSLWLDYDQYTRLPKKINRLQSLLDLPVRGVVTPKDPKMYTTSEIGEIIT